MGMQHKVKLKVTKPMSGHMTGLKKMRERRIRT